MKTQTFIKTLAALALIFALTSCKKSEVIDKTGEAPGALQKMMNPADAFVGEYVKNGEKDPQFTLFLEKKGDAYTYYEMDRNGKKLNVTENSVPVKADDLKTLLGKDATDYLDESTAISIDGILLVKMKKGKAYKFEGNAGISPSEYAIINPVGGLIFVDKIK